MSIIRSWSGDGLSAGAATTGSVGAGDTAFNYVDSGITITTDGTRSPRLTWPSTTGVQQVRWTALGNLSEIALRRSFSFTSAPTVTWYVASLYTSAGAQVFQVMITSTMKLRIRNNITSVNYDSPIGTLTPGQEYRVEATWDGTSAAAHIYEGDSTDPILTASASASSGAIDEIRIGQPSSLAIPGLTADDIAVADTADLIGPAVQVTPESNWYRLTGTGWVPLADPVLL